MINIKCDERGDLVSQCYDGIGSSVECNDTKLSSYIEDVFIGNTRYHVYVTLNTPDISTIQTSFINSLPYPFSSLDIRPAKSSSGKCWIFHMSNDGVMTGYNFPGGYRLYGIKDYSLVNGTFFIECRNCQKSQMGMVSAMLPKSSHNIGSYLSHLTLTYNITFCYESNTFLMNHHTWKRDKSYKAFINEKKTKRLLKGISVCGTKHLYPIFVSSI